MSKRVKELLKRLREIETLEATGSTQPEHKVTILRKSIYVAELKEFGVTFDFQTPVESQLNEQPSPSQPPKVIDVQDDESGWETIGHKGKIVRRELGSVVEIVTLPKSMCKIVSTKPDGSCLFQSLGYWLDLESFETRRRICNFISREASKLTIGDMSLQSWIETESDMNLNSYIDNLRKPNTWAGQAELFACSHQFNVTIFVWETDPSFQQNFILRHKFKAPGKSNRPTCHVLFDGSQHYDAINLLPSVATRIYEYPLVALIPLHMFRLLPRLSALERLAVSAEVVAAVQKQAIASPDLYEPWLNVEALHTTWNFLYSSGAPWWLVIGSSALLFRTLSLPLQKSVLLTVRERRAKLIEYEPARIAIAESMMRGDRDLAKTQFIEYHNAIKSRGLSGLTRQNKILMFMNGAWFLSFSAALRGLVMYPDTLPSFAINSQLLWVPSLALPDPVGLLPILASVAYLAGLECREEFVAHPQKEKLRLLMRGITFAILPLATNLPAAFYVFMACNGFFNGWFGLYMRSIK